MKGQRSSLRMTFRHFNHSLLDLEAVSGRSVLSALERRNHLLAKHNLQGLAYFEIRSTLARVLWHFDLSLEDESYNWMDQNEFTVWNKPHLWVKLSPRKD